MDSVRIGFVKYLNTLPLVDGLEACAALRLVAAPPSALGAMLARGEVDLALASLVDFARAGQHQGSPALNLVPCGMIGCDGPTLTVRVYSKVPLERVTRLHADTDSHTSVILAQVIFARRWGLRPEVTAFDHDIALRSIAQSGPATVLLIGDKVVTDAPPASLYPHQLDLGEAWHELTGLPFVYAMWMARRDDLDGPRARDLRTAADLLDRQRRRNGARIDWILDMHAGARGWSRDLARTYVTQHLRYEVTDRAKAGAEMFLGMAAELGLVPRLSEPAFAQREPAGAEA